MRAVEYQSLEELVEAFYRLSDIQLVSVSNEFSKIFSGPLLSSIDSEQSTRFSVAKFVGTFEAIGMSIADYNANAILETVNCCVFRRLRSPVSG